MFYLLFPSHKVQDKQQNEREERMKTQPTGPRKGHPCEHPCLQQLWRHQLASNIHQVHGASNFTAQGFQQRRSAAARGVQFTFMCGMFQPDNNPFGGLGSSSPIPLSGSLDSPSQACCLSPMWEIQMQWERGPARGLPEWILGSEIRIQKAWKTGKLCFGKINVLSQHSLNFLLISGAPLKRKHNTNIWMS